MPPVGEKGWTMSSRIFPSCRKGPPRTSRRSDQAALGDQQQVSTRKTFASDEAAALGHSGRPP